MVRGIRSLKKATCGSSSSQGTMAPTACRAVRRTSAELSFKLARKTCCSTGNDSCRCSPAGHNITHEIIKSCDAVTNET